MTDPKMIPIRQGEKLVSINEELVWGKTSQNTEDHRAEGLASGSVLPVGSKIPLSTANGQQH